VPKELEIGFYIAIGLIIFFLYRKKEPKPTELKLDSFKGLSDKNKLGHIKRVDAEVVDDDEDFISSTVFMHNGQKYDALEVLKVPMGATKKEIKKAYASKLLTSPEEAKLLIKAFEKLV
jgi:hypothetical protein